ncbi:hypothetical protein B8W93_03820 [Lentilactobacillus kefiri]|nr:hypothetical protein B9K02_05350 [Lentilactobacillus kefiri]PAK83672.1 hypothetical protein B8W85_03165 [Lentilactobacillus kefiri]PAL06871.1 hypothetical protein B8W93_03820 [Lentilactobacillus kefiri]QGV25219.1 hypothetical protein DNL43_08030 [Lentilactobacillus kefiri]
MNGWFASWSTKQKLASNKGQPKIKLDFRLELPFYLAESCSTKQGLASKRRQAKIKLDFRWLPFYLAESCSTKQRLASNKGQPKIKLDFRLALVRFQSLNAWFRTLLL